MFLNKKSLIICNQRRAKAHINIIKKSLFKEIEEIVNNGDLPLKFQESDNPGVFKKAYVQLLKEELKIWDNEPL